jgi:hypothetical protein
MKVYCVFRTFDNPNHPVTSDLQTIYYSEEDAAKEVEKQKLTRLPYEHYWFTWREVE